MIDVLSIILFILSLILFYKVASKLSKVVLFIVIVMLGVYMLNEHLDVITSIGERLLDLATYKKI